MNTRETKRTRDRLIGMSHSDGYLESVYPEATKLMREAAMTIQRLMDEITRNKARGKSQDG